MAIPGVSNSGTNYNVNQTNGAITTDPGSSLTGSGGFNSAGSPLPPTSTTYAAPPPPPPPMTQAELDDLAAALGASGAQIGASGFDYDSVMSELGNLVFQYLNHQRSQAMQQRTAGYESAKNSSLQQAGEMKNAADEMDAGAIKNMAIGITTAGVALIGSGVSLGKQVGSLKKAKEISGSVSEASETLNMATQKAKPFVRSGQEIPADIKLDMQIAKKGLGDAQRPELMLQDTLKRYQAGADLTGRVGDMGRQLGSGLDTRDQADAKRMEAEGQIDAADATGHQQKAEIAKEVLQAVDEMAKKLIEMMNEMKQNQIEMMRSITR